MLGQDTFTIQSDFWGDVVVPDSSQVPTKYVGGSIKDHKLRVGFSEETAVDFGKNILRFAPTLIRYTCHPDSHLNLVPLADVYQIGTGEVIVLYIKLNASPASEVMWHIDFDVMNRGQLAILLSGLCSAVIRMHNEMGLIHGDIKPDNILFDFERGMMFACNLQAMILGDYETVRENGILVSQAAMGTERYAPPELLERRRFDTVYSYLSDQYSLGLTIIEMLIAKFMREIDVDFVDNGRVSEGAINLLRRHFGGSVADVLLSAVQPNMNDRFVTMYHFQEALCLAILQ